MRAITNASLMRDKSVVRLSVTPSTKYSWSGSPPIFANGSTRWTDGGPKTTAGQVGRRSRSSDLERALGAFPAFDVAEVELRGRSLGGVMGSHINPTVFIPRLLDLHRRGRFPFDRLVRNYPFAELEQAIADSLNGATVKPVLTFD